MVKLGMVYYCFTNIISEMIGNAKEPCHYFSKILDAIDIIPFGFSFGPFSPHFLDWVHGFHSRKAAGISASLAQLIATLSRRPSSMMMVDLLYVRKHAQVCGFAFHISPCP